MQNDATKKQSGVLCFFKIENTANSNFLKPTQLFNRYLHDGLSN
jgi:hypothetical protein